MDNTTNKNENLNFNSKEVIEKITKKIADENYLESLTKRKKYNSRINKSIERSKEFFCG